MKTQLNTSIWLKFPYIVCRIFFDDTQLLILFEFYYLSQQRFVFLINLSLLIRPSLVHHVWLHRHVTICCQFSSSIQIIDMFSIEVDTIQNIWLTWRLYGRYRLYCKYVHWEQLQVEKIHKRNKSNNLYSHD